MGLQAPDSGMVLYRLHIATAGGMFIVMWRHCQIPSAFIL